MVNGLEHDLLGIQSAHHYFRYKARKTGHNDKTHNGMIAVFRYAALGWAAKGVGQEGVQIRCP